MFLSDPSSFVSGKTENESPEILNYYVGMWLEYAGVTGHVRLADVIIWVLTWGVSGELGQERQSCSYHDSLDGVEWRQT